MVQATGFSLPSDSVSQKKITFSNSPFLGQEFGFLHSGEAKHTMRMHGNIHHFQFDHSCISFQRKPTSEVLKSMESSPINSRILLLGSPVFTRNGTLLGLITGTNSLESDAGRRLVITGLIAHPRFNKKSIESFKNSHS